MVQTFIARAKAFGSVTESRYRYNIDGVWRWLNLKGINLLDHRPGLVDPASG
jgi:hypothetical protein